MLELPGTLKCGGRFPTQLRNNAEVAIPHMAVRKSRKISRSMFLMYSTHNTSRGLASWRSVTANVGNVRRAKPPGRGILVKHRLHNNVSQSLILPGLGRVTPAWKSSCRPVFTFHITVRSTSSSFRLLLTSNSKAVQGHHGILKSIMASNVMYSGEENKRIPVQHFNDTPSVGGPQQEADSLHDVPAKEQRRIYRKVDWRLTPMLMLLYFFANLDRFVLTSLEIPQ